jgi:hypothetical protein
MELRRGSKFECSLGHSVIENVLKSCSNKLAQLKLRAMPQLKFSKNRASEDGTYTKLSSRTCNPDLNYLRPILNFTTRGKL